MAYPVSNQNNKSQPISDDYAYDNYMDFEAEDSPDSGDQYVGDSVSNAPMSAKELRKRVTELESKLGDSALKLSDRKDIYSQIEALNTQIDQAQGLPSSKREAKMAAVQEQLGSFETKILGIDGNEDLPGGWGDDFDSDSSKKAALPDVTAEKIQQLLTMVRKDERKPEEGSDLTKDKCIQYLLDALQDINDGKTKGAASGYAEVLAALGGEKDPKEVQGEIFGETPSKVEGDKIYFDGKDSPSLQLKSPDTGKTVVIDGADQVQLTPKNQNDPVSISDDGQYYVVTMGSDTFQVDKNAKLHIDSDHVSGDVNNANGDLTVGASDATSQKYVSPSKLNDMANKISTEANAMQYATSIEGEDGDYGELVAPKSKYGMWDEGQEAKTGTDDAKRVLNALADAMRETDPKKRKEKMDNATEIMSRARTQNSSPGRVNNTAQLIFNVLYGELGEGGLTEALSSGMIPQNFVNELTTGLEADPNENTSMKEITGYQVGGPAWTHASSSQFLKDHSLGGGATPPNNSKTPSV